MGLRRSKDPVKERSWGAKPRGTTRRVDAWVLGGWGVGTRWERKQEPDPIRPGRQEESGLRFVQVQKRTHTPYALKRIFARCITIN